MHYYFCVAFATILWRRYLNVKKIGFFSEFDFFNSIFFP